MAARSACRTRRGRRGAEAVRAGTSSQCFGSGGRSLSWRHPEPLAGGRVSESQWRGAERRHVRAGLGVTAACVRVRRTRAHSLTRGFASLLAARQPAGLGRAITPCWVTELQSGVGGGATSSAGRRGWQVLAALSWERGRAARPRACRGLSTWLALPATRRLGRSAGRPAASTPRGGSGSCQPSEGPLCKERDVTAPDRSGHRPSRIPRGGETEPPLPRGWSGHTADKRTGKLWRPRTWETRPAPVGMSWAECDPA